MILRVPWIDGATSSTRALVELVDVLPTLADLANIRLPANESFEGESLLDLLRQKEQLLLLSQWPQKHLLHRPRHKK